MKVLFSYKITISIDREWYFEEKVNNRMIKVWKGSGSKIWGSLFSLSLLLLLLLREVAPYLL